MIRVLFTGALLSLCMAMILLGVEGVIFLPAALAAIVCAILAAGIFVLAAMLLEVWDIL